MVVVTERGVRLGHLKTRVLSKIHIDQQGRCLLHLPERKRMYIVNKDKTQIVNLEQVTCLYIGGDECTIKAEFSTGKGCQIARYDSHEVAAAVIEEIGKAAGNTETFFLPDNETARAKAKLNAQKWHHVTGKKTKGHGGS